MLGWVISKLTRKASHSAALLSMMAGTVLLGVAALVTCCIALWQSLAIVAGPAVGWWGVTLLLLAVAGVMGLMAMRKGRQASDDSDFDDTLRSHSAHGHESDPRRHFSQRYPRSAFEAGLMGAETLTRIVRRNPKGTLAGALAVGAVLGVFPGVLRAGFRVARRLF